MFIPNPSVSDFSYRAPNEAVDFWLHCRRAMETDIVIAKYHEENEWLRARVAELEAAAEKRAFSPCV